MCTDCFKIFAVIALFDNDFLLFRFRIAFVTSSRDTKVKLNVSGTISG